jgi:hypothetical protein
MCNDDKVFRNYTGRSVRKVKVLALGRVFRWGKGKINLSSFGVQFWYVESR